MSDRDLTFANSLADLAAQIRAEHEACRTALDNWLRHAILAGLALRKVRLKVSQHGQWLPWVRANCPFSVRTAQQYMQLAENKSVIEEQMRNGVAHLSINDAVALIAEHKPKPRRQQRTKSVRLTLAQWELIAKCLDPKSEAYAIFKTIRPKSKMPNRKARPILYTAEGYEQFYSRRDANRVYPAEAAG